MNTKVAFIDRTRKMMKLTSRVRAVGQRVASTFSAAGRVFLLGDAGEYIRLQQYDCSSPDATQLAPTLQWQLRVLTGR